MGKFGWLVATLSMSTLVSCSPGREPGCDERVAAAEAAVHTSHRLTDGDMPGIGDYAAVHWQGRAAGDPCSRVPGPTDWHYQDIIELRPADAETLASTWTWQPEPPSAPQKPGVLAHPTQLWPALAPYIPSAATWLHSDDYDRAAGDTQWHTVYFDPDRQLVLVFSFDH